MSKNAGPNNLSAELAGLSGKLETVCKGQDTVILARVVDDFSSADWQKLQASGCLKNWYVIPIKADDAPYDKQDQTLPVTPFREVYGALEYKSFGRLLAREMLRLDRNGGCLSLVGAALQNETELENLGLNMLRRLQGMLGWTILRQMADCDSLGILRDGQYVCSLPGFGQLAARSFAERCQDAFSDAANALLAPTGRSATCALGIVNVLQGEHPAAKTLLNRAKSSLEVALSKDGRHIYQETSLTPLENTTLVHSSEKRFLFFGEDPS